MAEAWKRNITDLLRQELERLQAGNKTERSRYTQAMAAIARVLQVPTNPDNLKKDLAGHWAADVGQQYRLFYYIENDHNVVNFVWLNNDEFIHTTDGPMDPCYEQFKKLCRDTVITRYKPQVLRVPSYKMQGDFLDDDYVYFVCELDKAKAESGANLRYEEDDLVKKNVEEDDRVFSIQFIKAEDQKLRLAVLNYICTEADKFNVHLRYFLSPHERDYADIKDAFLKVSFDIVHQDEKTKEEIFLRKYKR